MVERVVTRCSLCEQADIDFSLTDGRAVHKNCMHSLHVRLIGQLQTEKTSIKGRLNTLLGRRYVYEISKLQQECLNSFGSLKSPEPNPNLPDSFSSEDLKDLYDYWPDYPPDWEDRRRLLIQRMGRRCQRCGASGRSTTLQAHHIVPFWKDGSNKLDNLQLLCLSCHGHEHGKDFENDGFGTDHKKVSAKEQLIADAIRGRKKISFMYKKFGESRGTQRTILPEQFEDVSSGRRLGFTRCVRGHCDLRDEERVFAVHRMHKVKVH